MNRDGQAGQATLLTGRALARNHFEMIADRSTGLMPGDTLMVGRNRFSIVGVTAGQVTSSGDPVAYVSLLDSQELQFELAPAASRIETARGVSGGGKDTVNAVVARLIDNVRQKMSPNPCAAGST